MRVSARGGSPRFNVVTTTGLFFLGVQQRQSDDERGRDRDIHLHCADAGSGRPAGSDSNRHRQSASVLLDVQGTADLTKITFNGKLQKPAPGRADFAASARTAAEVVHEPEVQEPGPVS
jgi:hypothetical protein